MNPLEGALECSAIGLPVFPVVGIHDGVCLCPKRARCGSPGKHPLVVGWQQVATANQVKIREWARKYPECNFGIPCGTRTDVAVVDVDGYQGGRLRDLPVRPTVITTSGRGLHAWYRLNGGPVQGGDKKLGPGLGLRGEGHFVVGPGSLHANGKRYGRHRWGWDGFAKRPALLTHQDPDPGGRLRLVAPPLPERLPEGQRRKAMLSLAGSMRRRGSSGDAILAALAVENRARCDPPLEEAELQAIAYDVEGRYQPEIAERIAELEDEPKAPLEPAIPTSGLIAESIDYLTQVTMNPPEFALAASLFNVSAVLCGQVMIEGLGDNPWPPALWIVNVADPAGLKSAGIRSGTRLIDDASGGQLRIAEDFSTEALHATLADRPYGYMEHSEFGAFVNAARKKDWMGGSFDYLNRVYDGEESWTLRKGEGLTKTRAVAVAMISGTTWKALNGWVRADLLLEGFLTRPLYVPQASKAQYVGLRPTDRVAKFTEARNSIVRQLAAMHQGSRYAMRPPAVEIDRVAAELWNAQDEPWRGEDVDVSLMGLAKRRGGTALRLAVCYAAGRGWTGGPLEVIGEDVAHALAFVRYCSDRMFPVIEDIANQSKSAEDLNRVFSVVRRLGSHRSGGWVTRRDLMRICHLTKWDADRLVESLIEAGTLEQTEDRSHPGRASILYRVVLRKGGFAKL